MQLEIWTDASSKPQLISKKKRAKVGPSASSIVVKLDGEIIHKEARYVGELDNNQAEYEALLMAIDFALKKRASHVKIYTDSNLIACQINNKYNSHSEMLTPYYLKAKEKIALLPSYELVWIPRGGNREADKLAGKKVDKFLKSKKH